MSKVCILLANGFEEIEATTIIDVLRRADIDVAMLGVEGTEVTGAHNIRFTADATLKDSPDTAWDMVILPGGLPGAHTLRDDAAVQSLLRKQNDAGRRLAAICAAPIAFGKAGILEGKQATSYPGFEGELTGATVVAERVVKDGNIITSQGPGTAMEFALKLVGELASNELVEKLRSEMLV